MDKVMRLELTSEASGQHRCAQLSLPATDYEMLDALEKLQVDDTTAIRIEPYEYIRFPILTLFLPTEGHLTDWNALAIELSKLTAEQGTAFEGLLNVEAEKGNQKVPVPRLIDIAASAGANCCHVAPGIWTDKELGRFYAENGFVSELEDLSDTVFEMLDFEAIGRKAREEEHGSYIGGSNDCCGGYTFQSSELKLAYAKMDLTLRKPDYTILLELSKGCSGDSSYDNDKTVRLAFPATPQAMDAALEAVEAASWSEAAFRCLDCCVPTLTAHIDSDDNIAHINRLAQKLAEMKPQELTKFKAMLDATEDFSVLGATHIAYTLDDYLFSPQYASPKDMAWDYLLNEVGPDMAELLRPNVDLDGFGRDFMAQSTAVLTPYGTVERRDGAPIQREEATSQSYLTMQ